MDLLLINGFIIGLASNLHCLGMCGPIALAVPLNRSSNWSILLGLLQYNSGRIFTYFLLGILVSQIGLTAETLGILQKLTIASGLFLIFYAWRKYFPFVSSFRFGGKPSTLSKYMGPVLRMKNIFRPIFLGMLNGLLPCGMVFTALINTFFSQSPLSMITFGIGTLPAMMIVGFAANRINSVQRQKFNRFVPYLLTLVGLVIMLRGMNLDIPYLSPKVTISSKVNVDKEPEITMSCCHKNAGQPCETVDKE